MQTDREGRVVDERSWTPREGVGKPGELSIGGPQPEGGWRGTPSLANILRPAGRTDDGALRMRGGSIFGACGRTEVELDPETFVPRRLVSITTAGAVPENPSDAAKEPCPRGEDQTSRKVHTIESVGYLPATEENRRLLEIGDWPVERVVRWVGTDKRGLPKYEPLDKVPPSRR